MSEQMQLDVPITGERVELLRQNQAFLHWFRMAKQSFSIASVHCASAYVVGEPNHERVLLATLYVRYEQAGQKEVERVVFLRGGSAAIFTVVRTEADEYALTVSQERLPAATADLAEIPAGMLEGESAIQVAAKELFEELGIKVQAETLIDLNAEVLRMPHEGLFASAGGSDEFFRYFLCECTMTEEELRMLDGKVYGCPSEGERTTVGFIPLRGFLTSGLRCNKSLLAYFLYREWRSQQARDGVRPQKSLRVQPG